MTTPLPAVALAAVPGRRKWTLELASEIEARGFSGRVTFFIGKDGKVLHVEKKVKTKDHGKQIIDKLKELKVEPAPKDEKKKK